MFFPLYHALVLSTVSPPLWRWLVLNDHNGGGQMACTETRPGRPSLCVFPRSPSPHTEMAHKGDPHIDNGNRIICWRKSDKVVRPFTRQSFCHEVGQSQLGFPPRDLKFEILVKLIKSKKSRSEKEISASLNRSHQPSANR